MKQRWSIIISYPTSPRGAESNKLQQVVFVMKVYTYTIIEELQYFEISA